MCYLYLWCIFYWDDRGFLIGANTYSFPHNKKQLAFRMMLPVRLMQRSGLTTRVCVKERNPGDAHGYFKMARSTSDYRQMVIESQLASSLRSASLKSWSVVFLMLEGAFIISEKFQGPISRIISFLFELPK